jgi:phage-related protein
VKIEITPSSEMADACKIENQTNGKSFQYRGTVAAGEVLEVDNFYDGDAFQVLNDGADDIENFEGDFITLDPGDNTIIFTGTASTNVVITHRDTWY